MAVGGGARTITIAIQELDDDLYGYTTGNLSKECVIVLNAKATWVWSQWEMPIAGIRRIADTVIHEMVHVRQFRGMYHAAQGKPPGEWVKEHAKLFSKEVSYREQFGEIEAFSIAEASIERPSIWELIEPIAQDLAELLIQ
jgi:hypothetical protein